MSVSKIYRYVFTFIIAFTISITLFAQKSRKDLEQEKIENQRRISEAELILKQIETEKVASIGQLRALNRQIGAREDLIKSIKGEVDYLNVEINEITFIISSLESDLDQLRQEYASMIYSSSKAKKGVNRLTFLFSAKSFNQLLMRLKYLEQYSELRKNQVKQIEKVRDALTGQRESEQLKREEQSGLLTEQIRENNKLLSLKTKQGSLVNQLNSRQKELTSELAQRKKSVENLDKLIAELISREIKGASKSSVNTALSESFEKNQSKLPWPVGSGFISSPFGRHPHPVLKGIMVENQGVDIQTQNSEQVKAVFNGEVATVAFVPGMNNVVIVKHGEYYTLYAKLKNVDVKKGDQVSTAQTLGQVFTDKDGISEVQFQVWRNQQKMDPSKWLMANR
ncbi:MAG: peptidoglycan DD-metalloendopeptidase family protein [Bacteroidetes bacterium]|nr:peptidoglycan DD-metalloendopeptidase family protein [Bacteroidota bacterium]MDA1122000.1 peptidoglycan DD-metalloendopeptidase family protein [Bacteroidota bacterium]